MIFKAKYFEAIRMKEEHFADKKAIEADCAKTMYIHRKAIQSSSKRNDLHCYMQPEEIEEYARSINKWH